MKLVPTDESKDILKSMKKYGTKSEINNYLKIKFTSDDNLPLKNTLEFRNMVIVVRFVFHEKNKYFTKFYLDECLYKLLKPLFK